MLINDSNDILLFINPHLTPDAESEIASLYSSQVIAMCQLSLQSKQKV